MPKPVKKSPAAARTAAKRPAKAPASGTLPLAELDQLAAWLKTAPVNEVEIEQKGLRLRLSKAAPLAGYAAPLAAVPAPAAAAPAAQAAQAAENTQNIFKSPMVGTFYRSPNPEAQAFVKEGDTVSVGQPLCIIEAMKTMNQITSDRAGKITKVLTENAKPVEYGQPLFVIE